MEAQFNHLWELMKIVRDHEGLIIKPAWPENNDHNLTSILEHLDNLEYKYGWLQNEMTSIQEYTGLSVFRFSPGTGQRPGLDQ